MEESNGDKKKPIVLKSFQNDSFCVAVIFALESFDNIFNLIFCYFGVVDKTIGPGNYSIWRKKILSTCFDKKKVLNFLSIVQTSPCKTNKTMLMQCIADGLNIFNSCISCTLNTLNSARSS